MSDNHQSLESLFSEKGTSSSQIGKVMAMRSRPLFILLLSALMTGYSMSSSSRHHIMMDNATERKLEDIIQTDVTPYQAETHGEKISRISSAFLGARYRGDTLIGGPDKAEVLVIDFNEVDCTTFIDNVEALSRSRGKKTFLKNLIRIRYFDGKIDYRHRRHFFSDWFSRSPRIARDVTAEISSETVTHHKVLNRRPDGGAYVAGIGFSPRELRYIPAAAITENIVSRLKTGDYVGVYSLTNQEDVSHVGIVVRHDGRVWFRNASSLPANRKVVDSLFLNYMRSKPGIIVLRTE